MSKKNFNELAVFLKDKRKAAGVSQGYVAKKLGYRTPQFISNWERGISAPPIETLRELAEIYKVPSEEMLNKIIEITIAQVKVELQERFLEATHYVTVNAELLKTQ